jgi:hypothetical protein
VAQIANMDYIVCGTDNLTENTKRMYAVSGFDVPMLYNSDIIKQDRQLLNIYPFYTNAVEMANNIIYI